MPRILAIDFGFKRVGIAISDPMQIIASPYETIPGSYDTAKAADTILALLEKLKTERKYEISDIVIGLPLNMNGSDSERTVAVRAFAKALQEKSSLPIHLFDERLTTVQAERALKEGRYTRKQRTSVVDTVSAVILLQTYLSLISRSL
ncbi:MAG: Holliday junction resolvase RuvX [Verrucomicrobia bacterium]|nr:Holliday junction resolvase RuvX [Verrucomicrobiota bacterium]